MRAVEGPIASTSNGIDAESQGAARPMYTQDDGSDGEDEAQHDTEFTDGSDESDSDSELGGMGMSLTCSRY